MRADRSSRLFRSIFLAPRRPRSFQNSARAPEGLVPDVAFSTGSRLAICSALGGERAQDLQPVGLPPPFVSLDSKEWGRRSQCPRSVAVEAVAVSSLQDLAQPEHRLPHHP